MRLLFITRKFPPMVGGMEKANWALNEELSKQTFVKTIAWSKSQLYLPVFLLFAFFKSLYTIPKYKITALHLGDGLLSPLGLTLKWLLGTKVTVTVHGLDITYQMPLYQSIVPWCLRRLDKVICVSNATLQECIKRGIPKDKCLFIPNGIYANEFIFPAKTQDLERLIKEKLNGRRVLLTAGRLVKRKGVYWFIENVFNKLGKDWIYIIIGEGPEKARIKGLIKSLGLENRIKLLGRVSQRDLKIAYNTADFFVAPNIQIKGDMEGFGIVAIESASVGLPVLASNVDGIKDAVSNGKNGVLITPTPESWLKTMKDLTKIQYSKTRVRKWTTQSFAWENIGKRYFKEISYV